MKCKVCCIQNETEARMSHKYGAFMLGLVSDMPSGFRMLSDLEIRNINKKIEDLDILKVLLTSKTDAEEISKQIEFTNSNAVQIVDELSSGSFSDIRKNIRDIKIMQVLHVSDASDIKKAKLISKEVDFLLLDTGNPKGKQKVLGGTGKTHDWNISAEIVREVDVPVFLAGGLKAENIQKAIATVKPFGVDICTGLRDPFWLLEDKLKEFIELIQ